MEALALAASLYVNGPVIDQAAALPASQQPFAQCVSRRESGGRPDARNRASSAQGKYQFLDRHWRHGLAHMTAWSMRDHGMNRGQARALRAWLRARPIAEWPERLQDVAFAAVLNARGPWSGWRHWYLAGSSCNKLVNA